MTEPVEDKGDASLPKHALQQSFLQRFFSLPHGKKPTCTNQDPIWAVTLK